MPEQDGREADERAIAAVLGGDIERFREIVLRYQPRLFSMARRYSRREDEVQDIVQEILVKAYQRLYTWRRDAPFEHWLMRLAVRTCYDFLRVHQRNRESVLSDLTEDENRWLERAPAAEPNRHDGEAARGIIERLLAMMTPANRLVITLLELEDRSVKEIAALTGWSVPLVKVRAFRARAEMKKLLNRLDPGKFV
jgi:RNA polymerase sigma-70 factor (ECF subfamily)